ncbi:MAG: phosphotransferase [Clostridia bacterium]|nr:phosphotransferase [Clostridia bacterium]
MLIEKNIFPEEIQKIIGNKAVETDDVGRSGALVAFIGSDLVLKKAPKGKLHNAYRMQSFFYDHDLAPEVVFYLSDDSDYLISARASGKSAIDKENLKFPARLAGAMGELLLKIHSLPIEKCPVQNLTDNLYEEFDRSVQRNEGLYQHIADYIGLHSLPEAVATAEKARSLLKNDTVLHGDYCLPNIMLENLTGKHVIDVGEGGVGDRHFDLFWGLWSLSYNLKTDAYRESFLSAYGKTRIENDLIYACGCLCAPI